MVGHMIGAACAAQMAACCMVLHEGILPPTINYETPDPECDLNYVRNTALTRDVRFAVNNGFAIGGHNVSLVLKRVDDRELQRS